jgi:hypothetical protein
MTVCGDCANDLAVALLFVGQTGRALEAAYLKQQRFSADRVGVVHRPDESPVHWNSRAGAVRDQLLATLTEAADAIARAQQLYRPLNTFDALGYFLAKNVPWMRAQHNGPDMHRHLMDALAEADRVVDAPSLRRFVGECGALLADAGDTCRAMLWAPPSRFRGEVTCPDCGTTHDVEDRRRSLLGKADNMLLARTDLARALSGFGVDVTVKQLEHWAARGRLEQHGTTSTRPARPLYRLGDVLDVLAADRARHAEKAVAHGATAPDRPTTTGGAA